METDHRSTTHLSADGESTGASSRPAVDHVIRLARETFGSDEKAQRWLRRPTQALAGDSPLDVSSASASGTQKVIDLLRRIDHGLSV